MFERLQRAGHPVIMLTEQVLIYFVAGYDAKMFFGNYYLEASLHAICLGGSESNHSLNGQCEDLVFARTQWHHVIHVADFT